MTRRRGSSAPHGTAACVISIRRHGTGADWPNIRSAARFVGFAREGHPILGRYEASCSGHALNNKLLRTLLADTSTWEEVVFERYTDAPISYIEAPALHPPGG